MSTVAIFNGFGQYETTNEGQKGVMLRHGGVPFWLPYDKVTYIPDYTMREVDHDASTANGEEEGILTYKTFRLSGNRIAEELLETQIPYKNSDKGIVVIANEVSKRKSTYISVFAGVSETGEKLMTDVQEIEPTSYEIENAHARARAYKEEIIQQYFQTKRERMAGGHGQLFPTGNIKLFMAELGVKDIDDVTRQIENVAATSGISPEMFLSAVREIMSGQAPRAAVAPAPIAPPAAAPLAKGKQPAAPAVMVDV